MLMWPAWSGVIVVQGAHAMKAEIFKRGPISCAIHATMNMDLYTGKLEKRRAAQATSGGKVASWGGCSKWWNGRHWGSHGKWLEWQGLVRPQQATVDGGMAGAV
jgi:hypothetical protein